MNTDQYVQQLTANCKECRAPHLPHTSIKELLSTPNPHLSQNVFVDYMYFGSYCILHNIDCKTPLSAGVVCDEAFISIAKYALLIGWRTQFWTPESVAGDDAFNRPTSTDFVRYTTSEIESALPPRHSRNVLDSKHGILRSSFLQRCHADEDVYKLFHIAMAFDVSKQLCRFNVTSVYMLPHEFTKPLSDYPTKLPNKLLHAHNTLDAKRKLAKY